MERRRRYRTIKISTPIYTTLFSMKVKENVTWEKLLWRLLREKGRRMEQKAVFSIRVPEELYDKLKKLKERYGLTWDELFMYLIL